MTSLELPETVPALDVEHLNISYRVRGREQLVVRDAGFRIGPHESFGLVGESGCGKSTTAMAVSRYLPRNGRIAAGSSIRIGGRDLMSMDHEELRLLRAQSISTVYQEPARALNPSIQVGRQVAEVFEVLGAGRVEARERAEAALRTVQIADPGRAMKAYPHQLSGGMLQRVVIAMAICVDPALLVLDEPTTALDATVEAEILDLIAELREKFGTAVLMISHNLAAISKVCDRVGVMYAGEIVEQGRVGEVFADPHHPYTVGLMRCIPRRGLHKDLHRLDTIPGFLPRLDEIGAGCIYASRCGLSDELCHSSRPPTVDLGAGRTAQCFKHDQATGLPRTTPPEVTAGTDARGTEPLPRSAESDARGAESDARGAEPLIRLQRAAKTYPTSHGETVRALVDVDLEVFPGETVGIVGESGCGKSTLAKVLTGLTAADPGSVVEIAGRRVEGTAAQRTRDQLRLLQIVFQNPDSALNRRHSVRRIIDRALIKLARLDPDQRERRRSEIVRSVRMEPRHLQLRPGQLSGGLKQRVAIARAFAGAPDVLVCDEPTSALDVSVQAAVLNLLVALQKRENVAYLFISHDLGVVRYLSDRIVVLYLGRVMETGTADAVFSGPHHPYTEALLSSVPSLEDSDRQRIRLQGDIPSPAHPPSGCVFRTRCHRRLTDGRCETTEPELREIEPGKFVRCHLPIEELGRSGPAPDRSRTADV